jgi:hypothetical protein
MGRRLKVRDVLELLLDRIEQAEQARRVSRRRWRADYRRPGSLTYQRRQAQERWLAQQHGDP